MKIHIYVSIISLMALLGCSSTFNIVDRPPDMFEIRCNQGTFSDTEEDVFNVFLIAAERTLQMGYTHFYMWGLGSEKETSHYTSTIISSGNVSSVYTTPHHDLIHIILVEPVNEQKYENPPLDAETIKEWAQFRLQKK